MLCNRDEPERRAGFERGLGIISAHQAYDPAKIGRDRDWLGGLGRDAACAEGVIGTRRRRAGPYTSWQPVGRRGDARGGCLTVGRRRRRRRGGGDGTGLGGR